MAVCSPPLLLSLLPDPSCLTLEEIVHQDGVMVMVLAASADAAMCPHCGTRSSHVHSRYCRPLEPDVVNHHSKPSLSSLQGNRQNGELDRLDHQELPYGQLHTGSLASRGRELSRDLSTTLTCNPSARLSRTPLSFRERYVRSRVFRLGVPQMPIVTTGIG